MSSNKNMEGVYFISPYLMDFSDPIPLRVDLWSNQVEMFAEHDSTHQKEFLLFLSYAIFGVILIEWGSEAFYSPHRKQTFT